MTIPPISRRIRVLIADDSAFMRTALKRMIESDPQLQVVGAAANGQQALELLHSLNPDVVTLDIEMPGLDGLTTLKLIMRDRPRPVIMVSSLSQEGAEITLEALDCGAFDYIPKQLSYASLDIIKIREELIEKIKAGYASRAQRRPPQAAADVVRPVVAVHQENEYDPPSLVCIGSSTGGPKALQEILSALPADFPASIVIVQHMPPGFTGPFARRLDSISRISVREASSTDTVQPGTALIAPAGSHILPCSHGAAGCNVRLSADPIETLHRPSVDIMMLAAAESVKSSAMGVILTGMGCDGARGMQAIYEAGGATLGQDEASCAVYGMPRSCAERGVLKKIVPLSRIALELLWAVRYKPLKTPVIG